MSRIMNSDGKPALEFLFLILVGLLQVSADDVKVLHKPCPRNCLCSDDPNIAICNGILSQEIESIVSQIIGAEALSIANADIRYLKNGTLDKLSSLRELSITRSTLYGIEEDVLQQFADLTKLDLSSNKIEIIGKPESFLDKRFNPAIAYLPNFITSKNLRYVDLSKNNIKFVSGEELYGMKFVQHLNLSRNNIPEMKSNYRHLMGIKILDLSFNRISKISENFGELQMVLQELHLSNNYITKLPVLSYLTCVKLELLDVSFNEISSMSELGISNCSHLKILNVEGNKIKFTNARDLRTNSELETLNIARNSIAGLPDAVFISNSNLKSLYASDNDIQEITNETLTGLTSITVLGVERNNIHIVAENAFSDNLWLQYIYLQGNKIRYLFPKTFIKLQLLKIVNLRSNHLSTPFSEWFLSASGTFYYDVGQHEVVQKVQGSNATFLFTDNDWSCDCSAKDFLKWSHDQHDIEVHILPVVECASPMFHAGKNLLSIEVSQLSCDVSFRIISLFIFYVQYCVFVFIFLLLVGCWYLNRDRYFSKNQSHVM